MSKQQQATRVRFFHATYSRKIGPKRKRHSQLSQTVKVFILIEDIADPQREMAYAWRDAEADPLFRNGWTVAVRRACFEEYDERQKETDQFLT